MAKKKVAAATVPPATNGESKATNHADFVRAWQKARTAGEVDVAFGKLAGWASVLAGRLRKAGVPMKKMPKGSKTTIDVEELTRVAQESA